MKKFDRNSASLDIDIDLKLFHKGKVRNVFDVEGGLIMCASDRVSAFDCVFPNGIPSKGKVLTQISNIWFDIFKGIPNHIISTDVKQFPEEAQKYSDVLKDRSVYVKKCKRIDVECVVRGYIIGSGWSSYQKDGTICGIKLPEGLKMAQKLDEPVFTPAYKNDNGHDENISFDRMSDICGKELADKLRAISMEIYKRAAEMTLEKGIIIADTKFEFGLYEGEVILIDEVLTPDSSRFWPVESYEVGKSPFSYDKQFIRDYLESSGWDKNPPAPLLPDNIINKTLDKYIEAYSVIESLKTD